MFFYVAQRDANHALNFFRLDSKKIKEYVAWFYHDLKVAWKWVIIPDNDLHRFFIVPDWDYWKSGEAWANPTSCSI